MEIKQKATVEVQVNGEEAKKELRSLESYAISLKGRLAEAYKAGDTKKIKQVEKELRETNAQLKVMRTNTRNIDAAMNNIGLATPKELRNLIRDINAKLSSGHVQRGSAEWKKYQEQLKLVNAEIRKVNGEIKETQGWLTRFNNGFAKWGGLLASTAAGITGVSMALSVLRKNRDEKESSAANLKALTGLDDDSIQWLKRQAEILSTAMDKTKLRVTQSSKDILEAYMLVGSAKPELLTNKEALNAVTIETMRLASAAKMDLKDAVEAVTVSLNQYSAGADQAGRFTNVLAAGSQKGSANVVNQTAAIVKAGVSASGARVQFEELVGTIEMLGEKGIKDEVAGTGLKKFFLVLQTGVKETNPAIVGLDKALENLQKKRMSAKALKDMFGEEGYNIAKILIDNTAKVKEYTKAVTGTNVAMVQAAINSDTNEAKMAQYKNQIKEAGIQLMERLNPSLSALTGWTTKLIKAAPALIDFTKEYGGTIAWLSILIFTYMARIKIAATYQAILNTITMTATIVTGAYRLASVALNDALAGDYKALARFARQMSRTNIIAKVVTASTMLYRAAIELLTFRLKGAATAMKGFWAAVQVSKGGLLLAAIAAAVTVSYKWNKSIREHYSLQATLNKLHEKAASLYDTERQKMEKLWNTVHDNNKSLDDRRTAILELQKIMPEYQAQISQEGKVINETTKNLDDMNEALNRNIKLKMLRDELFARYKAIETLEKSPAFKDNSLMGSMAREDVRNKIAEEKVVLEGLKKEYGELYAEKFKRKETTDPVVPPVIPPVILPEEDEKEKKKKLKAALEEVEATAAKEEALIKEKYAKGETRYREYCKAINENDIKELENKMALYEKESNEYNQLLSKKQDLLKKGLEQETKFTIDEIEDCAKKEEISWIDAYHNRKISRYALNEALFLLDISALSDKQALYAKDSKEWQDYERQITDRENQEKLRKQEEYQRLLSSIRDQYSKKNIDQLMKEELDGIDYLYKEELLKEEEYQKLLKAIKKKYLKEKIDQADNPAPDDESTKAFLGSDFKALKEKYAEINDAEEQSVIIHQEAMQQKAEADAKYLENLKAKVEVVYSSLSTILTSYSNYANACQDLEIAKIEKKYDDEIKAAGDNTKKTKKLEEEKEKEVAKIKTKYNNKAMKIEIAQAFASMAMSAINAYSSAAQVPLVGYILAPIAATAAIAAGMMNIAAIKKQHQAQEIGYYSGGFTPMNSDPRKEVGIVHADEFVANHKAVNNPNIFPVLQLIDSAQKNNTVGSLTAEDISMSLDKGFSPTPLPTPSTSSHENDGMLIGVMSSALNRASDIMEKLSVTLDGGIESYVTIDGEHGFEKQYNHYKKLKANKSRL